MLPTDLAGWLAYVERQHPQAIALGLERVARVRDVLRERSGLALPMPIFIVGGTNGKGSTCAMLEAILGAAGFAVGCYTSPHLLRYNERVRVNGRPVDDARLAEAFAKVEAARGDTPLTYFEFGTLAAAVIFAESALDALALEVGMGGRLDAVNVFEPDCAIVTSVGLDHMEYLGDTREKIGWEKAHIFRPGKPAICGDPEPPASMLDHAAQIGADLQLIGRDFGFEAQDGQWQYRGVNARRSGLPYPALRGARQLANASVVLAALDALRERLPISAQAVREGLLAVALPGRFQVLPGRPMVILDVAHNPQAAEVLAENLDRVDNSVDSHSRGRTIAVFGMLADKDIAGVVDVLRGSVDRWHVATLGSMRGARADAVAAIVAREQPWAEILRFESPRAAYSAARAVAGLDDKILIFGSFLTVADVLSAIVEGKADH